MIVVFYLHFGGYVIPHAKRRNLIKTLPIMARTNTPISRKQTKGSHLTSETLN